MPELTNECIDELNKAVPLKNVLKESQKHRGEYNCINPECLSDHHVKIFPESNRAHCAKCDYSFSAIDWIMQRYGMNFYDVCKALSEHFGIELQYKDGVGITKTGKTESKHSTPSTEKETEDPAEGPETDADGPDTVNLKNTPDKYKTFLEDAKKDVDKGRDYLHGRGLSDDTINNFCIGYREDVYFLKAGRKLPAVVFGYNSQNSYYEARSIDGKFFAKPAAKDAGKEPLFNPAALSKGTPCFVCESILDALSIIDVGGNACATNGTAFENLMQWIDTYRDKLTAPLILSFDNDKPEKDKKTGKYHRHGQEAQRSLSGRLDAMGINYICADYTLDAYDPDKDANDFLRSNRNQFESDVKKNIAIASDETGIDAFMLSVSTEKYKPIPTGIKKIDETLQGGFIPQTLALIGGAPGTGKTIFASMLFESIAKGDPTHKRPGHKCLYINYEMAKEQLYARSIARRAADLEESAGHRITALDVLQNYRNSEITQAIINDAAEWYKREVAPNLLYNPFTDTDVDGLIDYLNKVAETAENNGEPVPLICIDYLHLLTGEPGEDPAGILKRALTALKQFAVKHNTVVIGIQAQNREANKKKTSSLDAGRDTSNLEYGADIVFQLVKKDPENNPDDINICITKSRFTETRPNGIRYELQGDISKLVYQGFQKH